MLKLVGGGHGRRIALTVLFAVVSLAAPLAAAKAPAPAAGKNPPLRMLDARVNYKASYDRATKARSAATAVGLEEARQKVKAVGDAVVALRRTMPGLDAKISVFTGAPDTVRNKRGALTAAAPGVSSEQIVRGFLAQHGDLYGLSAADLSDLVVLGDSPGGRSNLRMLRLEQQIDGRPVFQSETRFLLDREGRLVKSVGLMMPNARAAAARSGAANLIAPGDAVARLLASAGRTAAASSFSVTAGNPSDAASRVELAAASDDFVLGTITARQMFFPLAPGVLVPAWSLVVFTAGDQDWYAMVDAQTGDVLWRKNIRNYVSAHDARFRVFVQADGKSPADSPAPQSPNTAAPGGNTQFPGIAPTIVSMHTAYDPVASPNGWIDDCPGGVCTANETQTLGNNTITCLDREAPANTCDTGVNSVLDGNGRPMGNPDANSRNRDFLGTAPRDFETNFLPPPQGALPAGAEMGQTATGNGAAQTIFRRGSVTQLFYITNWYHDQLFALGFDEAAGNFQQTNFSGMGLGNDRILGDAQDNASVDNANFSTPPDGTSGRMQMFRFTGPTVDRDGGLDAEIVIHEITHGTTNRLVGNAAGLNWDPGGAMGEGWGDFYAQALLNNTNADDPDGQYQEGGYITFKAFGFTTYQDNYVYGIRRFPYHTNNAINPMTWADIDDVTNNLSGGIAPDPLGNNFAGGMEVHNAGEIWALTLWEVRSRIIDDPLGANGDVPTGNQTTLQLVTDGLKMTPVDPSFTDARDALLEADCATNACANEMSIWGGFADRGLGYGSSIPYNLVFGFIGAHLGVEESFQSPYLDVINPATDVAINDTAGNNNGAIDPGEPILLTVTLTNPWRGVTKAVASATATLTTSTPGVTIVDGTSTYGPIAPQGTAAGDTFQITVGPAFACGGRIDFTVTTVSSLGTTSTSFQLRVGAASGTDAPITYTGDPNPDLVFPDLSPRGVTHSINITDDFVIADLDFRINSITHDFAGDVAMMLRSPQGTGVDFVSLIDAVTGDFGGPNITNMVTDDEVPFTLDNDMVQAVETDAPYTGDWLPVFNAPWAALVFGAVDPVGNLSRFDGQSTLGTWTALVADEVQFDSGVLNAWSMTVTPVHYACIVFDPTPVLAATKTVSGNFNVGGTVTYTVTITNSGGATADNVTDEFTDTLPATLTLVSATATSGTATANVGTNTVSWNGALATSASVTITITATVDADGADKCNQGTAFFDTNGDGTNDGSVLTDDPTQKGATDPTCFSPTAPNVTGTKTVSAGPYTPGGSITYTITLTNSGSSTAPDTPGSDELTDVLPSSLTLTGAMVVSGGGTVVPNLVTNTVTWNGSITPSASVVISITATIDADATGSISNQGTIQFDRDGDGTAETTVQTDDPAVAGGANPTVFGVVGPPSVIPTVSEVGLVLLALALMTAAWIVLRRRTSAV